VLTVLYDVDWESLARRRGFSLFAGRKIVLISDLPIVSLTRESKGGFFPGKGSSCKIGICGVKRRLSLFC
jgi:hypothetical protein